MGPGDASGGTAVGETSAGRLGTGERRKTRQTTEATRLDAVDALKSPAAGVLSYKVALGGAVAEGDVIAELIDPAADDPAAGRHRIVSRTDGLVLSRRLHKYVLPGMTVAKVVGSRTLPHRSGCLLED